MKDIGAFCSVSLDFLGIYYIEKEKKVPINPRDLTPGCLPCVLKRGYSCRNRSFLKRRMFKTFCFLSEKKFQRKGGKRGNVKVRSLAQA